MASDIALTDTQALLWGATGDMPKLGRRARRIYDRAVQGLAVIYVPTLVLAEVAESVQLGRVRLTTSFESWMEGLLSTRLRGGGPHYRGHPAGESDARHTGAE